MSHGKSGETSSPDDLESRHGVINTGYTKGQMTQATGLRRRARRMPLHKDEGNESVTDCNQLKLKSPKDGKRYKTDVANTEQLLRIIQSMSPTPPESIRRCSFLNCI